MASKVDAYNKRTGAKLPYQVPEHWFDIFPDLRKTPIQKAREAATKADTADSKKEG